MAKSRRKARVLAMQVLYTLEVGHSKLFDALRAALEEAGLDDDLEIFADELVRGVALNKDQLDGAIKGLIEDWDYERIAAVDKCILRVAAYELFHCPDVPPVVSINEAVELAKKYSTAESGKFVNGVLGRLLEVSPKADWKPEDHPKTPKAGKAELEEPAPPEEEEPLETDRVGLWKIRSHALEEPPA